MKRIHILYITLHFIPWSGSLILSLFSYPNRNIKSLSEIQIVQVACGYYHSLALSKGKPNSPEVLCNFLPGNSEVFNIYFIFFLKRKYVYSTCYHLAQMGFQVGRDCVILQWKLKFEKQMYKQMWSFYFFRGGVCVISFNFIIWLSSNSCLLWFFPWSQIFLILLAHCSVPGLF